MPNEENVADPSSHHWFAGRDIDVLLYRVNRRPHLAGTLLEERMREQQPADVLEHLAENLLEFDPTTESGRRFRRVWQIGNVTVNRDERVVVGRIGWRRTGESIFTGWDDETRSWVDQIVPGNVSGVAPFAFDGEKRFIGVLKHPSFTDRTVAQVLTELLNRAEQSRDLPTTEWDVEPVGDREAFLEWLATTDQVISIQYVFKRPNPDAESAFEELFERLDSLRAKTIKDEIIAADPRVGLDKNAVRNDRTSKAYLAAAMAAFGYVVGRGMRRGRKVKYDQRRSAAREQLHDVGGTWEDAANEVARATRRATQKRVRDG